MPTHKEVRVLPYSARQLFDLVADIGKYPEFLPWCLASRHLRRDGDAEVWQLVIGFKMVREKFTSRVVLSEADGVPTIDVSYVDGPMKHMQNHWLFKQLPDGGCEIDFFVDFEFRSRILQTLIGALFHEAVTRMVRSFEARAADLYGDGGALKPA